MITINSFSITQLNNQEFCAMMINLKKMLRDSDTEMLGLDEGLMDAFDAKMLLLTDQVYASTASPLTQQLRAADEKRNILYRRARMRLQLVEAIEEDSPLTAMADVVKTSLLGKYSGRVTQMPMQEKTAVIQGFVYDIRHLLSEDDIDALSLTEDTGKLDQANNDFINTYNQRLAEKTEQAEQSTVILRQELTELYQQICFALQYFANHPSAEKKDVAAACQTFIRMLNGIVGDAKARYNQRRRKAGEPISDDDDTNGGSDNGGNGTSGNTSGTSGNSTSGTSGSNTGNSGSSGNSGSDNGNSGSDNENGTSGNTGGTNTNTDGTGTGNATNTSTGNGDPGTIHDGVMEF